MRIGCLSFGGVCGLALLSAALLGFGVVDLHGDPTDGTPPPSSGATPNSPQAGALRPGDHVTIELTGTGESTTTPPQSYEISADGAIVLPFIGRIQAAGKTAAQLQNDIVEAYVPAWYKHVNVTVTTPLRFFYVGGQVIKGDRFAYTSPITVTAAIQAAGGFDPYANKRKVRLTRSSNGKVIIIDCKKVLDHPELDPPVYPGDKIDVPRRYW